MKKECPQCINEFDTNVKSDKWCSHACRDAAKAKAYIERWSKGKPKTSNGAKAFRIFSLNGSLNGGLDHL